jgi:hypothetical protein
MQSIAVSFIYVCIIFLQDVTADEFHNLMELLGWTRLGHIVSGQQELVDIVAEQAEINQNFDPKDVENDNVDRLIQCVKHALPYFSVILYPFFLYFFCSFTKAVL